MNLTSWLASTSLPKISCFVGANFTVRRLALTSLTKKLKPSDVITVDLDEQSEGVLWLHMFQYPTDPSSPVLIVVKNAHKVDKWVNLFNLHAATLVNHVIFCFDSALEETHFAYDFLKRKAKFVDCSKVSDDELMLLMRQFGLSQKASEVLLERSCGDLKIVLNIIEKTKILEVATSDVISALCNDASLNSFSDYLIFGNKAAAVEAISNLTYEDSLREVQFLFSRLTLFHEMNEATRFNNKFAPEIALQVGVKVFLVKKYQKVAKSFDDRKIMYKRTLLVAADSALRDSSPHALLALVAMW